ncbi:glycosyltransferase family 2 protein [Synechococcus sp. FGCU-3]|nr:glycosyltransferase family 2 protein [Synechococcus sp. FGCU3]
MASLVIPYFKRAKTINRALESAEFSTAIIEVIVVDDELSGDSRKVMNEACRQFPKTRIVENKAIRGALGARATGALAANNDLIVFLDSDDEVVPEGIAQCLNALCTDQDLCMAYGNVRFGDFTSYTSDFLRLTGNGYLSVLKNLSLCPFSGLCIRKSLIQWEGLRRDLPAWQDDEFVLTASRSGKIRFVDCVTAIMHDSGEGRISSNKQSQLTGLRMLLEKWGDEIIMQFGIFYIFLWKLRILSILLKILSTEIEQKKRLSKSRPKAFILKFQSFSIYAIQRLLRRIFRVFFDRVYA